MVSEQQLERDRRRAFELYQQKRRNDLNSYFLEIVRMKDQLQVFIVQSQEKISASIERGQ